MTIQQSRIILEAGPYCFDKYGVLTMKRAPGSRGGEELKETHTRASVGSYVDRDGIMRSAAIDVLRPSWMYSNEDLVTRKQTIALEEAGTNNVPATEDLNNATYWTKINGVGVTPAALVSGSLTLDLLTDDSATLGEYLTSANLPLFTITDPSWAPHMKKGSASVSQAELYDTTTTTRRGKINVTWNADGTVASTALSNGTLLRTVPMADGVYRFEIQCTGVVIANIHQARLFPVAETLGVSAQGSTYFGGIQVEDAPQPSSYIKNVTVATTRNRDVLSFPLYVTPSKNLCIYHRHIERDATNWASNYWIWSIASAANANPRLHCLKGTSQPTNYRGQHLNAAGASSTSEVNLAPAFNDLIETRTIYDYAAGTSRLGASKNLAAETLAAAGAVITRDMSAWSDTLLHINSVGATSTGRQGWIATIVATFDTVAPSMAEFRELLV